MVHVAILAFFAASALFVTLQSSSEKDSWPEKSVPT